MLSRLELGFNAAWIGEHKLQEVIQHFVGRGNGANGGAFLWTREDKSHDPEWVKMLIELLKKVHGDLASRLKGLTGEQVEALEENGWLEKSVVPSSVDLNVSPLHVWLESARTQRPERLSSPKTSLALRGSLRNSRKLRATKDLSSALAIHTRHKEIDVGPVKAKIVL